MNILTDWIEEVRGLYTMQRAHKVLDLLDALDLIQELCDELELNVELDISPINPEEI